MISKCKYVVNKHKEDHEYCDAKEEALQMFQHNGQSYCKNHIICARIDPKTNTTKWVSLRESIQENQRV